MKLRLILAALFCLLLAGCGNTITQTITRAPAPTLTFSEPNGTKCVTRNPPAGGECIRQAESTKNFSLVAPLTVQTNRQCADWSQYQGYYPDTNGLHCVIIQAAYGLNEEPSVREQIRDVEQHGIPYGVYNFGEPGISGESEAHYIHALAPSAPLGYWFDAEVSGVFWRSCEFTSEARNLGERIYGVFSYPGGYAAGGGTRCSGYLWTSEWGVAGPSPFGGYPASAIKLWQYCGTCFRFGVETDLDVDEGLIALSKPAPVETASVKRKREQHELEKAQLTRHKLHSDIEAHKCRRGEHNLPRDPEKLRLKYHRICGTWIQQGGKQIALEQKLKRELAHG